MKNKNCRLREQPYPVLRVTGEKFIDGTVCCRQRMPNKHVYYYRSPEHQQQHVLSFAFAFDREEDVYQFALTYPYSYSRCQAHLDLLERKALPHFKRELLATSVQQRRVDLLTITQPNNMTPGGKRQHVVVILSRIHPGESPTSYVCQGSNG
ncbi:cytosolic carboxypeptidase 6-like [Schistocerca americana]|uniref:cytosolic carboxypeptidase 6-like n=1 Tax=Schistocerca americana TaxID=7009 RepID=UPI001F4FE1EE|nr:cytosolic carboxypeptidase 6-like [Schistocerca americana]